MLRQGKTQGWLSLPPQALTPWAHLNGVRFHEVKPGHIEGRGSALIASKAVTNSADGAECLLTVPKDLILSLEQILEQAKVDRDFRDVLESLGDFGRCNLMGHQTPRGAILCFLLFQASIACPDLTERVGVHGPFTDYVKALPLELLPTFWTPSELQLLIGTTLAPATASKLRSLHREWDLVCESAANTRWYQTVGSQLEFDDWLQVDAMYRSRALDYPLIGHCMVPCVDLANHAPHEATIAIYEKDASDNAVLVLRDGKLLKEGDEVTISYGDEKGACEMLFSYGFLDEGMETAETLFLSLVLPESDVMRTAKMQAAECAPGFKLIDAGDGEVDWKGEFVWLLCVGEEDGLHFDVARTTDGEEEIHGFFKEHELSGGAAELYRLLGQSDMYDVYRLRAVIILQQRVFDQMQVLYASQEDMEEVPHGDGTEVRQQVYDQAMKLRRLEFELMERAYEDFEKQKLELSQSDVVKQYLAAMQASSGDHGGGDEDFS